MNGSGGGARLQGIQTPPKNCHGGNWNSPTKEGREFRSNVHEGHNSNTSADDKRPLSQCYMMGLNAMSHDLASYCRLPTVTLEFGSPGRP